jgi:hypothetical protein
MQPAGDSKADDSRNARVDDCAQSGTKAFTLAANH